MLQRKPRFSHEVTRQLYEYWNMKRGSRAAPVRAEIEPSEIRTLLPDTFILATDPQPSMNAINQRFIWRLAGTKVCALHCRDLKDHDFLADWTGREHDTIEALLQAVISEAAVTVLQFQGNNGRGQALDVEMVLMPLSLQGRGNGRVLGAMTALNDPYWLGIQPPLERKIGNTRLLWPSGAPHDFRGEVPSLSSAAFSSRLTVPNTGLSYETGRRYRHLMVMDGGKAD